MVPVGTVIIGGLIQRTIHIKPPILPNMSGRIGNIDSWRGDGILTE
jgi:hypothetical protein